MLQACHNFRDAYLEAALGGDESGASVEWRAHREGCADCVTWSERVDKQVRALRGLSSMTAPSELDERLEGVFQNGDEDRFARLLGSLETLRAPAELDERMATEGLAAPFLRTMTALEAPSVLDRLVEEELLDPALARMKRFPGDLERLEAPASLADRLDRSGESRPRPRRLAPLVAAVAAAFLLWVGLRTDRKAFDQEPAYSFQVSYANASALEPIAASLAGALSGGSVHAVETAPDARDDGREAIR